MDDRLRKRREEKKLARKKERRNRGDRSGKRLTSITVQFQTSNKALKNNSISGDQGSGGWSWVKDSFSREKGVE